MEQNFVGGLACSFAVIAAMIALGPWSQPYQLRSIKRIDSRFGRPAARLVWGMIATSLFAVGVLIITGWRPAYASDAGRGSAAERLASATSDRSLHRTIAQ